MLVLEDLKGKTEMEIKEHLIRYYSDEGSNGAKVKNALEDLTVLIAYESVGSWGCDSTSFFLFKDSKGKLYELHGSHCSCYGFEGQFRLEKTERQALMYRVNDKRSGVFCAGGYDFNEAKNHRKVHEYIKENL